jgi:hypothetical protein
VCQTVWMRGTLIMLKPMVISSPARVAKGIAHQDWGCCR